MKVKAEMTDEAYPILILEGEGWRHGYSVDEYTGELTRICLCAAHCSNECMCGAWDD